MNRTRLSLVAALLALGCNSAPSTNTRSTRQALTSLQNRVLGFETPNQDWSATNGATVGSSSMATQGASSLSVVAQGYTEVASVPIAGIANPKPAAELKVQLPQTVSWGDARLIVQVPSAGQYWRDLGSVQLSGKSAGVWHTLKYTIPADVQSAMAAASGDLTFRLALNVPSGLGAFLIDDLVVDDETPSEEPPADASLVRFSLTYPGGAKPTQVFMSALDRLTLDDGVTAGVAGEAPFLASIGPSTSEFGARVKAYADVTSEGDVDFLRSDSSVFGDVTTEGAIVRQNNVTILGAAREGVVLDSSTLEWDVDWPTAPTQDISLPPDTVNTPIAPGSYDEIHIFSRATATFRAGNYYIESLVVEPEAHLKMDTSAGPIQFYVRDVLRLQVGLEFDSEEHEQVLFGYFGSQVALFGEALHAAVVAPNSPIELRRPNSGREHKGAFFGKEVHVFSDATVHFEPLDLAFLCSANAPAFNAGSDPGARDGNISCPSVEDLNGRYDSVNCLVGTDGAEFVGLTDGPGTEAPFFFGQNGDDIVLADLPNAFVVAGAGEDLVCAISEGTTTAVGGPGDDLFYTTGDRVMAIPGAGADTVRISVGHTDIYINHPCELVAGETYELTGGTATVHSPITMEEMRDLGVVIDEGIEFKLSEPQPCYSSCSAAPICAVGEECVNADDDGGFCVDKDPEFERSTPIDDRYSELSASDAADLREYVRSIERGTHDGMAPHDIRERAPFFEKVLIASIDKDSEKDRSAEIFALGSLYTDSALAELERIGKKHAPPGLELGHLDFGEGWYGGQYSAVLWLHAAAKHLNNSEDYIQMLLNIVAEGDQFSAETAAQALIAIGPEAHMRTRIAAVAPAGSTATTIEIQ